MITRNFYNCTPHTINVCNTEGKEIRSIESSAIARCKVEKTQTCTISGFPIFATSYGEVEGLPPVQHDNIYIVSFLVRQALPERGDLVSPGELLRDEEGQPIGCIGFNE